MRRQPITAAFAAALVAAALAGCVVQEAGPEEGDGAPPPMTEDEAFAAFENATRALTDPGGVGRFAVEARVEPANATDAHRVTHALLDRAGGRAVVSMNATANASSGMPGALLVAQFGRTFIAGTPTMLASVRDPSAAPVGDYSMRGHPMGAIMEGSGMHTLGFLNESRDALQSHRTLMHEGEPAVALEFARTSGPATGNSTVVVWLEPERIAHADVTANRSEAAHAAAPAMRMVADFAYDENATHPSEDALARAASLTFLNATNVASLVGGSVGAEPAGSVTYTVEPTDVESRVPLAEAELRVLAAGNALAGAAPAVVLAAPLENASAENADVRVTYVDADADGHVSPGDTLTMERLTQEARTYSLALHDEQTGMTLVSGGLLAGMARAVVGGGGGMGVGGNATPAGNMGPDGGMPHGMPGVPHSLPRNAGSGG